VCPIFYSLEPHVKLSLKLLQTPRHIEIENNNESLTIPIGLLKPGIISTWKKVEAQEPEFYYYINKYLEENKINTNAIMDIYKKAIELIDNSSSYREVEEPLRMIVSQLYDIFVPVDFRNWFLSNVEIKTPVGIMKEMNKTKEAEGMMSREKTFLESDYKELFVLSQVLRVFLPIYGYYDYKNGDRLISSKKSYFYWKWLMKSRFLELPGYLKLKTYAEVIAAPKLKYRDVSKKISTEGSTLSKGKSMIMDGVSRSDRVIWEISNLLLSSIVFRKLHSGVGDKNMVVSIYTALNPADPNRAGLSDQYRTKRVSDLDGEEDRPSALESYKTGTDLSTGGIEEMNFLAGDPHYLRNTLNTEIPDSLLNALLANAMEYMRLHSDNSVQVQLRDCQRNLISYIMSKIMDPEAILYVDVNNMANLIAVSQGQLIHHGFGDIAMLLTTKMYIVSTPSTEPPIVPDQYKEPLLYKYPPISTEMINISNTEYEFSILGHISYLSKDCTSYRWGGVVGGDSGIYHHKDHEAYKRLKTTIIERIANLYLSL